MSRKSTLSRIAPPLALALSLALAAPAFADSVATEQQHGAQILSQIQHDKLNRERLTSPQYENLGEYLMGRALGSTPLHQRMNTLMDEMMGPRAADQMHIYLGERYLGVSATPTSRNGQLWGLMGVMMSGYHRSALAGMMGAYLSGQGAPGYRMGPGMMGGYGYTPAARSRSGWPTAAVIAVCVFALLLVAGVVAVGAPRLGRRSHAAGAATPRT
jgi:hypothetical protein